MKFVKLNVIDAGLHINLDCLESLNPRSFEARNSDKFLVYVRTFFYISVNNEGTSLCLSSEQAHIEFSNSETLDLSPRFTQKCMKRVSDVDESDHQDSNNSRPIEWENS